ncbi:MAG: flagellar hook-length control protein FliK [Gammaproteobacteria bacterium]|nr:flagellar hook-length control protein FliK [Gammaproteobacteria bacterium]
MLQTSSSSPSLGVLSLDVAPKGAVGRPGGSTDGFTQEYDKQVKKAELREQKQGGAECAATAANDAAECKKETVEKAATKGDGEEHKQGEVSAAETAPQDGNTLPLEEMRKMAAEVQLALDGVESPEEIVAVVMPSLAVVDPAPQELVMAMPLPAAASALAATGTDSTALTEEPVGEEGEPYGLLRGERGREAEATLLLTRHAGNARPSTEGRGGEAMPRGDRGFEGLLAMAGRADGTAAPLDTLTPTLAPLAGQGAGNPLATPAPVAMTLAMPMSQPNWGGAVAERVVWMTNANIQEAEIQLNPRELGPIGIRITVNNEQTHVSFVAQNAATREALEAALPRLREMLNENGLQAGNTDVSQHSFRGREGTADGGTGGGGRGHDEGPLEDDAPLTGMEGLRGVGYATPSGVDAFA